MSIETITCDVLIVGSGPGGSVTAMMCAEAGRDVLLVEDGLLVPANQAPAYSLAEMDLKYRHGGLSISLGDPKVAYLEGRCVGGASEINAGLYNRPSAQTLDDWARDYRIDDFSASKMESMFVANEAAMAISVYLNDVPVVSKLIRGAANRLGWQSVEVPRMWDYRLNKRQSMTETFIPRFLKAGGRLRPQTRVKRICFNNGQGFKACANGVEILFNHIFICAGAIQTPLLLRKSGIKRNVGNGLRMHPAVRVVAAFDYDVNDPHEGVPVYQVSEFKPQITLGGSYSGQPHLALWLSGRTDFAQQLEKHRRMAIFYALIIAQGKGKVRALPWLDSPLVSLPIGKVDLDLLHKGLTKLEELLTAAGAIEIIKSPRLDLSAIHLFCSCPMGEDQHRCAVDSYGKLHGFNNIYLNDASILPSSPGVNPQATIMAVARRNAQAFLK